MSDSLLNSYFYNTMAFGVLNFFRSVFGELTESMIICDVGVKDSGSLIHGHGNYKSEQFMFLP